MFDQPGGLAIQNRDRLPTRVTASTVKKSATGPTQARSQALAVTRQQ
jgi:hypothetical protein